MKNIKDIEVISKLFSSHLGCKISLHQSRFSEEQEDTIFTIFDVSKDKFQVEETKIWYEIKCYRGGESLDKLILE